MAWPIADRVEGIADAWGYRIEPILDTPDQISEWADWEAHPQLWGPNEMVADWSVKAVGSSGTNVFDTSLRVTFDFTWSPDLTPPQMISWIGGEYPQPDLVVWFIRFGNPSSIATLADGIVYRTEATSLPPPDLWWNRVVRTSLPPRTSVPHTYSVTGVTSHDVAYTTPAWIRLSTSATSTTLGSSLSSYWPLFFYIDRDSPQTSGQVVVDLPPVTDVLNNPTFQLSVLSYYWQGTNIHRTHVYEGDLRCWGTTSPVPDPEPALSGWKVGWL